MANFRADTDVIYRYGVPAADAGITTERNTVFAGENTIATDFGFRTGTNNASVSNAFSEIDGIICGNASVAYDEINENNFVYFYISANDYILLDKTNVTRNDTNIGTGIISRWDGCVVLDSSGNAPADNGLITNIIGDSEAADISGITQLTDTDGIYITGNLGEGTVVSLTNNVLLVTEDVNNVFDTDSALYQRKRALSLHDSGGDFKGIAYIAQQNADSGNNKSFTLDTIVDDFGETTNFINHKGESVSITTTDIVALTGTWQDIDSELGDDFVNNGQYIDLSRIYHFGNIVNADHMGVAFFAEGFTFTASYRGITNGRLRYGSGVTMFGRVMNYQTRQCATGADVQFNFVEQTPDNIPASKDTDWILPNSSNTTTELFVRRIGANTSNEYPGNTDYGDTASRGFITNSSGGDNWISITSLDTDGSASWDDGRAEIDKFVGRTLRLIEQTNDSDSADMVFLGMRDNSGDESSDRAVIGFPSDEWSSLTGPFRVEVLNDDGASPENIVMDSYGNIVSYDYDNNFDADSETISFTQNRGNVVLGSGNDDDKIITGFNTTSNTTSGYGSIALWWSGNVVTNTNRVRLVGFEDGDPNARNATYAASNFFNIRTNGDIYSAKQGQNFGDAINGYGGPENNYLVNPYIDVFAANAIALRYNGTLVGGTINCLNAGSGTGQSLSALGINNNDEDSVTTGSPSNVYINAVTLNPDGDAVLGIRANGNDTTAANRQINVNTTSRIVGKSADLSGDAATNVTTRWEYQALWHNLSEGSVGYLTYDSDFTADEQSFGAQFTDDNFAPVTFDEVGSNGQGTVSMVDMVTDAVTGNSGNSNSTDDYGYFMYTTAANFVDGSPVTYSWKNYGYNDVVVKNVGKQERPLGGLTPRIPPIEANIDTESLGGGLDGAKYKQTEIAWLKDSSGDLVVSKSDALKYDTEVTLTYYSSDFSDSDVSLISYGGTDDRELLHLMAGVVRQTSVPDNDTEGRLHRAIDTMDSDTGWYHNPTDNILESRFTLGSLGTPMAASSTGKIQVTSVSTDQGLTGIDVSNSENHNLDLDDFELADGINLILDTDVEFLGDVPASIGSCTLQGIKNINNTNTGSEIEFTDADNTDITNMKFNLSNRTTALVVKNATLAQQSSFEADDNNVLSFVEDRTITLTFPSTVDAEDVKITMSWAESVSETDLNNPGTFDSDTSSSVSISDSGSVKTITVSLNANQNHLWYGIAAEDTEANQAYEVVSGANGVNNTAHTMTSITNGSTGRLPLTTTSYQITDGMNLANTVVTVPSNDTDEILVRVESTGGTQNSMTETLAKDWVWTYIISSYEYLEGVGRERIPSDYFTFNITGSGISIPDTDNQRFSATHDTDVDNVYEVDSLVSSSTNGDDLWRKVSSQNPQTRMVWLPTTDGMSAATYLNLRDTQTEEINNHTTDMTFV